MSRPVRIVRALAGLLLVATAALNALDQDPQPHRVSDDLVVERLADGLWLYRSTFPLNGRPVESNGLVVGGGAGAVVVDTPWDDARTAVLLDWVEAEIGDVRAVVATHFHPDRLGGIAEVHRRGIPSHGHVETARLALANDLEPPRHTFRDAHTLDAGARTLELFYPGPGHSADNSVVWLPEERLLFGGCLLKATGWSSLGFIGDAVVERWAASLEALLERYSEARIVVPGHGDLGDLDVVRHTRALVHEHLDRASDPAPATDRPGRS